MAKISLRFAQVKEVRINSRDLVRGGINALTLLDVAAESRTNCLHNKRKSANDDGKLRWYAISKAKMVSVSHIMRLSGEKRTVQ